MAYDISFEAIFKGYDFDGFLETSTSFESIIHLCTFCVMWPKVKKRDSLKSRVLSFSTLLDFYTVVVL